MSLSDYLSKSIEDWISASPRRSFSVLSRLSGISYSSVRRIASGENTPSLENSVAIAMVVMDQEKLLRFMREYFPRFQSFIENTGLPQHLSESLVAEFLISRDHAIILALASNETATSRDEVFSILGTRGTSALQELIDEEMVIETENGIIPKDRNFSVGPKLTLQQIRVWSEIFDFSSLSIPNACSYSFVTDKVNEPTLKKLHDLDQKYLKEKLDILNSSESSGNIPVYSAAFTNILKGPSDEK